MSCCTEQIILPAAQRNIKNSAAKTCRSDILTAMLLISSYGTNCANCKCVSFLYFELTKTTCHDTLMDDSIAQEHFEGTNSW